MQVSEPNYEQKIADFESTPLFMTNLPEDLESNDTLAAIQSLIYDGTPEEIASNFKQQGNEAFQMGKKSYQDAISYYTKGIEANCEDPILNSILYCNRGAVHYELGNYRKVLHDCSAALKFDKNNIKAYYRSAKACLGLDKPVEGLDCVGSGLTLDPVNASLLIEREKCQLKLEKMNQLSKQKKEIEEEKKKKEEKLLYEIKMRGIKIGFTKSDQKNTKVPDFFHPKAGDVRVAFDEESQALQWPVMLFYPEFKESDFITSLDENNTMQQLLQELFQEPPHWDVNGSFSPFFLDIYFESQDPEILVRISKHLTLLEVLMLPEYKIFDGVPSFLVLNSSSPFTESFKKHYKSLVSIGFS